MALGAVTDPTLRRRNEMVADCLNAMISTLAVGHTEGRYPAIEEAVDLLVHDARMRRDTLAWLGWGPADRGDGAVDVDVVNPTGA